MSFGYDGVKVHDVCLGARLARMQVVLDERVSAAQALLAEISRQGVSVLFGAPRACLQSYRFALRQIPFRYIEARHARGAVLMADGFARVKGQPAGVLTTAVAGFSDFDIISAVDQACMDDVPMVILNTILDHNLRRVDSPIRCVCDQTWKAVAGSFVRLYKPEQGSFVVARSFARMGICGRPIVIEVPFDVLRGSTNLGPRGAAPRFLCPSFPQMDMLNVLRERLLESRRPFFVFGGRATTASHSARALVNLLGAPSASTVSGKGIVDEANSLSLGANLQDASVRALIDRADLVVAIGTGSFRPNDDGSCRPSKQNLVRIDVDTDALEGTDSLNLSILGDARSVCECLLDGLKDMPRRAPWAGGITGLLKKIRRKMNREFPELCAYMDALYETIQRDIIIFSDFSDPSHFLSRYFISHEPRRWFHVPSSALSGYAIPAAIGGALADLPSRRVVALADRHGISCTQQEIQVAVENKLSLPIIVWDGAYFGMCQEDGNASRYGHVPAKLAGSFFQDLARAYGAKHVRVINPSQFASAIEEGLNAGRPTLIEIGKKGLRLAKK